MHTETTRENDARIDRRTGFGPQPILADGSGIESDIEVLAAELTKFQRNALLTLAPKDRYGIAIKEELEKYYDKEVLHGRLYPNLNELVEHGLVEKSERDRRTNNYSLTRDGQRVLEYEHWHTETYLSGESR